MRVWLLSVHSKKRRTDGSEGIHGAIELCTDCVAEVMP